MFSRVSLVWFVNKLDSMDLTLLRLSRDNWCFHSVHGVSFEPNGKELESQLREAEAEALNTESRGGPLGHSLLSSEAVRLNHKTTFCIQTDTLILSEKDVLALHLLLFSLHVYLFFKTNNMYPHVSYLYRW